MPSPSSEFDSQTAPGSDLKGVTLSDEILNIKLQVLSAALEFGVDLEHVDFVKLLRSQLDVLVVELVEVILQFGELVGQLGLVLDIRLHLSILSVDPLLKEALLSLQLVNLTLLVFVDLLGLPELLRQPLDGLLHLTDQILQLLYLLMGQLLIDDFLPHIVFLHL